MSHPKPRDYRIDPTIPNTVLVVVCPRSASFGRASKLRPCWDMIGDWFGPLFVIDDDVNLASSTPRGNTLLEAVDVAIDERESIGIMTRIRRGETPSHLSRIGRQIGAMVPRGSTFVLTGSDRAGEIASLRQDLLLQGHLVTIDDTAITDQDIPGGGDGNTPSPDGPGRNT